MAHPFRRRIVILGQTFIFDSNSRRLLRLVDIAYRGLPAHRQIAHGTPVNLRLHLARASCGPKPRSTPPEMKLHGAMGLLCGAMDSENYAVLSPAAQTGLVVVSPGLLKYSYHVRYELLEFAVFTSACRVQGLVPLHAACVGLNGRGLLLIGAAGAGKSTLAMMCAMGGMDFVTEDATFICPRSMRAVGVANYLHIRRDALRHVADRRIAALIRRSPLIRRRSGVKKYEIDLRKTGVGLAGEPLKIAAIVFVTSQPTHEPLLSSLQTSAALKLLVKDQPYGAAQPGWPSFARHVAKVPTYKLHRGHPLEAVDALRRLVTPQ